MAENILIKSLVLTIICVSSVLCLSEQMEEMAKMLHATCVSETGVTESLIDDARKGNFAEDNNLKCYMKCLMAELGSIDDDGVIDTEALIAVLPDEFKGTLTGPFRKCGGTKGTDACDTAFQANKCVQAEVPNDYFLI